MEDYLRQQNNVDQEKDYEISHVIGLNTSLKKCVQTHPTMSDTIIYSVGGILIAEDLNEKNNQVFFRHGKNQISSFCISTTGRFIAIGFTTENLEKKMPASIILWDYEYKKVIYELTGIYKAVNILEFSQDDKFLAASGLDNSIFIWDVMTGEKCFSRIYEFPTNLIYWTTIDSDKKYPSYTLTEANVNSINYFQFNFELKSMQYSMQTSKFVLPSKGWTRTYTCALYDRNLKMLYVGTTAGELVLYSTDNLYCKATYSVISNGVTALVMPRDNSMIIGGGDGKIKKMTMENGKQVLTQEIQLDSRIISLSLTSDKKEVIVATLSGYIYRVLTDDLTFTLHSISHTKSVNDCVFLSPTDNERCFCVDDNVNCFVHLGKHLSLGSKRFSIAISHQTKYSRGKSNFYYNWG